MSAERGLTRTSLLARALLPALWMGLVIGISFLEAPLKFQAPGITTELGLGIGRLVFQAANISGVVLLLLLTVASIRPRVPRFDAVVLLGLWLVLAIQILGIRPPLNARTDILLAGGDPGPSALHYLYIAADVVLLVLLAIAAIRAARDLLDRPAPR